MALTRKESEEVGAVTNSAKWASAIFDSILSASGRLDGDPSGPVRLDEDMLDIIEECRVVLNDAIKECSV